MQTLVRKWRLSCEGVKLLSGLFRSLPYFRFVEHNFISRISEPLPLKLKSCQKKLEQFETPVVMARWETLEDQKPSCVKVLNASLVVVLNGENMSVLRWLNSSKEVIKKK